MIYDIDHPNSTIGPYLLKSLLHTSRYSPISTQEYLDTYVNFVQYKSNLREFKN